MRKYDNMYRLPKHEGVKNLVAYLNELAPDELVMVSDLRGDLLVSSLASCPAMDNALKTLKNAIIHTAFYTEGVHFLGVGHHES